jgi:hypothetical protein
MAGLSLAVYGPPSQEGPPVNNRFAEIAPDGNGGRSPVAASGLTDSISTGSTRSRGGQPTYSSASLPFGSF